MRHCINKEPATFHYHTTRRPYMKVRIRTREDDCRNNHATGLHELIENNSLHLLAPLAHHLDQTWPPRTRPGMGELLREGSL